MDLREFQLTAARRRLGRGLFVDLRAFGVSTHSRPKAAGKLSEPGIGMLDSFNSQPPEGGWIFRQVSAVRQSSFNSQPPEGGWTVFVEYMPTFAVSTHSRPKAAG